MLSDNNFSWALTQSFSPLGTALPPFDGKAGDAVLESGRQLSDLTAQLGLCHPGGFAIIHRPFIIILCSHEFKPALFRCLKSVDQPLGPFQALVGPNASGKTTFLDVIGFLSALIRNRGDVLATVQEHSANLKNCCGWSGGIRFSLRLRRRYPNRSTPSWRTISGNSATSVMRWKSDST